MTDGTPTIEVRDRDRIGQVIVPIPLSAIDRMTPTQLAETYAPIALATAREHGGTLQGTPEILRREEILPRMADAGPELLAIVHDAERSAFLLATMVPHDWTAFDRGDVETLTHLAPTHRPRKRRGRR